MSSPVQDIHGLRDLSVPPTSAVPFAPLPAGQAACAVTVVRAGAVTMPMSMMVRAPTADKVRLPVFTFLIEHESGRRVVFDLGLKANLDDYPPVVQHAFGRNPTEPPPRELAQMLEHDLGVPASSVEAVVLSHTHWDHIGNINAFPASTELIVGAGTLQSRLPGYPADPDANLNDDDLPVASSRVRELGAADAWTDVGAFRGLDYFGDGSFYILVAEGHMVGHIAALVRTTVSPPSFLLLAGDAAHLRRHYSACCCGAPVPVGLFEARASFSPNIRARGGLLALHDDLGAAYATMGRMARMEEELDVCVFLAHDKEWEDVLDREQGAWTAVRVDGWLGKGWKALVRGA